MALDNCFRLLSANSHHGMLTARTAHATKGSNAPAEVWQHAREHKGLASEAVVGTARQLDVRKHAARLLARAAMLPGSSLANLWHASQGDCRRAHAYQQSTHRKLKL